MASFNTGVHPSEVMGESDKSLHVVVPTVDGVEKPYFLSKRMTEWKQVPGEAEPLLFAQTWYMRMLGIAE